MKRWYYLGNNTGRWSEDVASEEARQIVQPIVNHLLDVSELGFLVEDARVGLACQSDWIGAALPHTPSGWASEQQDPSNIHVTGHDYAACLMALINAQNPEWMYTIVPHHCVFESNSGLGTETIQKISHAWRRPPRRHPPQLVQGAVYRSRYRAMHSP